MVEFFLFQDRVGEHAKLTVTRSFSFCPPLTSLAWVSRNGCTRIAIAATDDIMMVQQHGANKETTLSEDRQLKLWSAATAG
jgi:hypothetical protein